MRLLLFCIPFLTAYFAAGLQTAKSAARDSTLLRLGSFLGGEGNDRIIGMVRDTVGNIFVAGVTESSQFPVTANAVQSKRGGDKDCFLAKISTDGKILLYSTFFGGSERDEVRSLTLDALGNPLIAGVTYSTDFPVSPNSTFTNGQFSDIYNGGAAFVARFSSDGAHLLFSAVLGGVGNDAANDVTVAKDGTVWVAGSTTSLDFPVSGFAQQPSCGGKSDGFLAEINANGTPLVFSTYFGGSGDDGISALTLDDAGNVYVAGTTQSPDLPGDNVLPHPDADVFMAKYREGTSLEFTHTFILSGADAVNDVVFSPLNGQIYCAGASSGLSFVGIHREGYRELSSGGSDAYIIRMNTGGLVTAATFFGGSAHDFGYALAVEGDEITLAGTTESDALPATPDAFSIRRKGGQDGFAVTFDGELKTVRYCTYAGGSGDDVATAATIVKGTMYFAGTTGSPDFPVSQFAFDTTYGGGFSDGFVQAFSPVPLLTITPNPVLFGEVEIGAAVAIDTPVIKNLSETRTARVEPDSIRLENNGFGAFSLNISGFIPTLPPGVSSKPRLTFTPQAEGNVTGLLEVWANNVRYLIPLEGTGVVPPPQFSAPDVEFDTVEVNTQTFDTIHITNLTNRTFTVDSIRLIGTSGGRFAVLQTTPFDVLPLSFAVARAMFFPENEGQYTQTVQIFARNVMVVLRLRGFAKPGAPPPIDSISVSDANFGDVTVQTTGNHSVVIRNLVPREILLDSTTIENDIESVFTAVQPVKPLTIGANDSLVVTVKATPLTTGQKTANMAAYLAGRRFTGKMIVNGTPAPQPELSASAADFGSVVIREFRHDSVLVKNTGNAPADMQKAEITADADADFTVEGFAPRTLAAFDSMKIYVKFAPQITGAKTASVKITTDAGIVAAALSGIAAPPPDTPRIVVERLTFRRTLTDSLRDSVAVVISSGNITAQIDSVSIIGDTAAFSMIFPPAFPQFLPSGQKLMLGVRFTPKTETMHIALLRVYYSSGKSAEGIIEGEGFRSPDTPVVVRVRVTLPLRTAAIGETVDFPMIMTGEPQSLDSLLGRQFTAKIRFNTTVMAPADGRGETDDSTHTVTFSGVVTSDTLVVFHAIAALGNADSSTLRLLDCTFTDGGKPFKAVTTLTDGLLRISDIWRYGGPRLVGGIEPAPVIVILLNPVAAGSKIQLYRVQPGCTLSITDVIGKECARFSPQVDVRTGEATVELAPNFARGIYYCRVVSGSQSAVKALFAE